MAINDVLSWASGFSSRFADYLSAIVIALVILLLGFIIARIADRSMQKLLLRADFDTRMARLFRRRLNYARGLRVTIVRILYLATVLIALERIGASGIAVMLVAGALALIALLSLIVAGIDVIPNLLARAELNRRGIGAGDLVELLSESGTVKGRIVDITLTDVHLRRAGGDLLFIPNAAFLSNRLVKKRR